MVEHICLQLIKAELWGFPIDIPEAFDDWDSVVRVARKQSVLPLVGNRMITEPQIAEQLSSELKSKIRSFVMSNMLMHQKINHVLLSTKESLEKHGISPVLLKGQGVASNYPNSYLRQCGDIDFYVGEDKYEDAYEIIKSITTKIDDKDNIYNGKHFHAFIDNIELDVHRFCGQYSLKRYNRKFQEESLKGLTTKLDVFFINDVSISVPSKEFNAYYIFNHLFNHFQVSGVGLRHLCDLMMFLHTNYGQLNLSELERILCKMALMQPWKLFGGVLVDVLGMPAQEFPFYEKISAHKVNRILQHIWDEGNFGFGTDYYLHNAMNGFSRIFQSFKYHVIRFARLFTLMPGASIRRLANYFVFGFRNIVE